MKKEIYTLTPTPFAIARKYALIKTTIEGDYYQSCRKE